MEVIEVAFVNSLDGFKEQVTELTVDSSCAKFRDANMMVEMIDIITHDTKLARVWLIQRKVPRMHFKETLSKVIVDSITPLACLSFNKHTYIFDIIKVYLRAAAPDRTLSAVATHLQHYQGLLTNCSPRQSTVSSSHNIFDIIKVYLQTVAPNRAWLAVAIHL
jgi:hypothetical protein